MSSNSNIIKLVLLRHGESKWNQENRFTGWTDIPLTEKGVEEAHFAAKQLKEQGFTFDVAYTSVLTRSIKTLWIVLEDMNLMWIPIHQSWRLNERMYGALQGLNKIETAERHGEEQVKIWRRSYSIPPPSLKENDERYPGKDPRYKNVPKNEIPLTECLKDTVERFLPYWKEIIVPSLMKGNKVLIVAHGNSIRALIKHLDNVSDDDIVGLDIPTGIPLVYEIDKETFTPIKHYYLADEETVKKACSTVANQSKLKS